MHQLGLMRPLDVSIDIDAPAKHVWDALVDLESFHEWNPFIRDASGDTKVGGRIRVRVRSSLGAPIALHAEVVGRVEERELRWRGHVLAPWLGAGEHTFRVEPLGPSRTRFTQHEVFTGALPRLFARLLAAETRRGFAAMNRALAVRAERASRASVHAPYAPP